MESQTNLRTKSIHLPGLNGIRAFAAIAVVVSHTTLALNEFGLNNKIFGVEKLGNPLGLLLASHAVTISFVLSGFLITYLTLLEKKAKGKLDIRKFYIRRILRIWPLYYMYILICTPFLLKLDNNNLSDLPFYLLLLANVPFILGKGIPLIVHYWSLGVEEQFYLFFSALAKLSVKKLLYYSLGFGTLLFILKIVFWGLQGRSEAFKIIYQTLFITRFYSMFIGVIGAILFYWKKSWIMKIFGSIFVLLLSWSIIILLLLNLFHIAAVIDSEIVAFVALSLIIGQITMKGIISLESNFFDFLGKTSFGIYVIHPLIIFLLSKIIIFNKESLFNYLVINIFILLFTILIAHLSYVYFEKSFLKMKAKFSVIKSSITK